MLRAQLLSQVTLCEPSVEWNPADQLEASEIAQAVRDLLAKLPPNERDAIQARTRCGESSCRAVAKSYGVSPQTVCNWADSAEMKLRPMLEAFR